MCPLMIAGAWKHPLGGMNWSWCSCSLTAIFDLAYSIRIAPRSDDSKYLPCNICIAWPAQWTSRNSTKATGMWLAVGCVVPCPPVWANCWIAGWLDVGDLNCVCIRRRLKPGRLLVGIYGDGREKKVGWSIILCDFQMGKFFPFVSTRSTAKVQVNYF